ncbi:hypothetical protein G5I_03226 [Acromyrmex echinatior]|uniref:Uncharacterized protein n=1 Tax=Acromyrmex echinatior TaxID=103372 RepID=F4WCF2_ACREC|nr:hypothetical protein G5I_03226 [Acromyrmex echinatior]
MLEHETLTSEKGPGRVEKVRDGGLAAAGRQKGEPVINTWEEGKRQGMKGNTAPLQSRTWLFKTHVQRETSRYENSRTLQLTTTDIHQLLVGDGNVSSKSKVLCEVE